MKFSISFIPWKFVFRPNDGWKRWFRFSWEKFRYGYCGKDFWSLDTTLAQYIHPRLVQFKRVKCGYPGEFKSEKEWDAILDKMIFAFEMMASDEKYTTLMSQEKENRVREGLKLFGKHFASLWY